MKKQPTVRRTIRLPADLDRAAVAHAERQSLDVSGYLRTLIEQATGVACAPMPQGFAAATPAQRKKTAKNAAKIRHKKTLGKSAESQ